MPKTDCCVLVGIALQMLLCFSAVSDAAEVGEMEEAVQVLTATDVQAGLIVHVGCGDGKLTAALGARGNCLVHGLEEDAQKVRAARKYIQSLGLYGKLTVERWSGGQLPYIDNLANLVVAENPAAVSRREVMRVLRPGGVACVKEDGRWVKRYKPWPKDIDEWTHFLHDASGNAVAHDSVVGPPRRMQWLAAPQWSRNHHKLASISSVVSTRGRLFYLVDEASAGSMFVPGRWSLVARDAFNGILLWKKPISSWAYERHGFRAGPVQLPRLLVAVEDRVYMPLGMNKAATSFDAATGDIITTYEQTEGAEEIIVDGGVLLVVKGVPIAEHAAIHPRWGSNKSFTNAKSVVAIEIETGEQLWTWQETGSEMLMPLTLSARNGRVFFQAGNGVTCLDLRTGKVHWNTAAMPPEAASDKADNRLTREGKTARKRPRRAKTTKSSRSVGWSTATLVVCDEIVLWANAGTLKALSVRDSSSLWHCACKAGFKSPVDVFVADGLVWVGPDYNVGRDLRSGNIKRRLLELEDLRTAGHHHRCYREKATDRYIIGGYRGMEFFDLAGDDHSRNNWVRGTCQYGILPCNGLVYAPPHACGCFMEAKLYGFWAIAPEGGRDTSDSESSRLQKGPAYVDVSSQATRLSAQSFEQWPTYRHDMLRSGSTASTVPATLKPTWQIRIAERISPPVVAEDTVLVSAIDEHRVIALDAWDGSLRWSFTAGGRVDSPPTVHGNLVLFGSADGYMYCVRLTDGAVAWRFRASPRDLRTVAFDRVESVWPMHGSVLVLDGIAYVTAGRSSYLDGGIYMYGLEPTTGEVLYETCVFSRHPRADEGKDGPAEMNRKLTQNATDPKTFQAPDLSDAFSMKGGTTTDVLVSDGTSIYLRTFRFNKECVKQERAARHLFSTSSLLDGSENHRSHWMMGTGDFSRIPVAYSWIADRPGRYNSHVAVPYSLMLTFDDKTIWGIRRLNGYTLYADVHGPSPGDDEQLPDLRPAPQNLKFAWKWSRVISMRPRALVRAGQVLLLGGMATLADGDNEPGDFSCFEGRGDGWLWAMGARDGNKLSALSLEAPPVWDGIAVADERVYVSRLDGVIECLSGN